MTTYTILLRRDVAADWTSANPILANGELGVETDTGKLKIGDGATAWNSLAYFSGETEAHDHDADYAAAEHTHTEEDITDLGDYAGATHNHDAAYDAIGAAATVQGNLDDHEGDTANPHAVTAAQAAALPEDAGINAQNANYELVAGDAGKVIECDGTFTVTLPNGLDTGFQATIVNVGGGTITLAATTTLQSAGSAVTLATQYKGAVVYHRGSNVWLALGGLE